MTQFSNHQSGEVWINFLIINPKSMKTSICSPSKHTLFACFFSFFYLYEGKVSLVFVQLTSSLHVSVFRKPLCRKRSDKRSDVFRGASQGLRTCRGSMRGRRLGRRTCPARPSCTRPSSVRHPSFSSHGGPGRGPLQSTVNKQTKRKKLIRKKSNYLIRKKELCSSSHRHLFTHTQIDANYGQHPSSFFVFCCSPCSRPCQPPVNP